jgi:AraC family transcriptional activator of pobA
MTVSAIGIKNKLEKHFDYKVSRFKEIIKRTKPHKHDDYFEIIYLSEGEGFHQIEDIQYKVNTPEFYILKPGQLHYWQFTAIPKGFVVMFRPSLFDTLKDADISNLLNQLQTLSQIKIHLSYSPANAFEEMLNEYASNTNYTSEIIKGYIKILIIKIIQLSEIELGKSVTPNNLYARFCELIQKEVPALNKVYDFASLLNTTPQNINAACRRYGGKSASQLIGDQILLEAKRYILHTELTVSEIAFTLSFNDSSHFVKFFKKAEGITPIQFRKKHFQ